MAWGKKLLLSLSVLANQSRIVSDFFLCFVVLLVFLWIIGRALR